ncbi:MAG TPA: DUF1385 domain-containing protein [Gaiellaceae bacterium]
MLVEADTQPKLPRLGGMARPNGVVIVSERYWAFAGDDGSIREGEMPRTALSRVPLLRGLVKLGAALSPLFRHSGVAGGREKPVLAVLLVAPLGFVFLPGEVAWAAWAVATAGLVLWLFRGRTLRLHGAEHRAIAAVEQRRLAATWAGEAQPSRFSPRCGTNFAALVIPVTVVADRVWPLAPALYTPALVTVLSLALTMELWRVVQASRARLARAFLLPGLALQRLTTREPSVEETRVALTAVESVLRRELG